MKRYRHYKKGRAIVLSCFGSVVEQDKYLSIKSFVEEKFPGVDVFIAFGSRMVIKLIKHREKVVYKTLPQVLADCDMAGYNHVTVASINLFPTDEHNLLKQTVDGFNLFSMGYYRATNAMLTKTKESTKFLTNLNNAVTKEDTANLFVIHGTPRLDIDGIDSINYCAALLEKIKEDNYTCSLEGAFPFFAMKDALVRDMRKAGVKKVQIIPMLLVSGNHYIKDMEEIKDELTQENFEAFIVPSTVDAPKFTLLEFDELKDIIVKNIKEEITKSGCKYDTWK